MAGTLTVEHAFGDLTAISGFVALPPSGSTVVFVDSTASPVARIVFTLNPTDSAEASGFEIRSGDGITLYATGDYPVGMNALGAGATGAQVLAALVANLANIELADGVDADIWTLRDVLSVSGNGEGTSFVALDAFVSIDAGGGDDTVTLHALADGATIDGGAGKDTLALDLGPGVITTVIVDSGALMINGAGFGSPLLASLAFAGFEIFRGGEGQDYFWASGAGYRFTGGDGEDQFTQSGIPGSYDIVDYGADGGTKGIVVNFGDFFDVSTLPAALPATFGTFVAGLLEADPSIDTGRVRDTYGNHDWVTAGFRIEGSQWDDAFVGSADADHFDGGAGDDRFFGGGGNDTIVGGGGDDRLYFSGAIGDYTINGDGDDFIIIGSSGTTTVSGVERFVFDDGEIEASDYAADPLVAVDDDNAADGVVEAAGGVGDGSAAGNVLDNDTGTGLSVSYIRLGASAWTSVTTATAIAGTYGSLSIAADGTWSYTLDEDLAQALKGSQIVYDAFSYRMTDGSASDEADLKIKIVGSNDAPTSGVDAFSTNEDVDLVTAVSVLLANDTDPEGETLTFQSVQSAVKGTVSVVGSNVVFTPTPGLSGAGGYTYTVTDASGASATHTVSVTINDVNDAPVGADKTVTVLEDGSRSFTATDFGFSDTDGHQFAAIVITVLPASGTLLLSDGAVSVGQVISVASLGNLVWSPAANQSGAGLAWLGFKVRDDGGTANGGADTDTTTRKITFDVTPVNDAPNGDGGTVSVLEDATYMFSAGDFGFSDSDGHSFKDVTITSLPSVGVLRLGSTIVQVGDVIAVGSITSVTWAPPANQSGAALASFGFKVRDTEGTANGGVDTDPTSGTITFNVTPVNDAPNGAGSTVSVSQDGAYTFAASDFGFSDSDGHGFASVVIASLPSAGTLKLGAGAVSVGDVIAVGQISALTWTPPANQSGNGLASFSFSVRDTGGTANGGVDTDPTPGTITFNVTAVTVAAPVNSAPDGAGSRVVVLEDGSHTFSSGDFGFIDGDGHGFKELVITSLPAAGVLKLGADVVNINDVITVAQIGSLTWAPPANQSGTALASFGFRVRDTGGTSNGGVDTDPTPGTITFDVTRVNDAPNGAGSTVLVAEDVPHVFGLADFGFSDSDGDALKEVVVTALPGTGLLKLGDGIVGVNAVIAAADIDRLTWTPPANVNGSGIASFSFVVRDTGGTADGGADTDATPGTITFTVTEVNDAPSAVGSRVLMVENTAHAFALAEFGFSDSDGHELREIIVTSLPSVGELTLGGANVAVGQAIEVAQLTSLSFAAGAAVQGSATLGFRVRDTGGVSGGGVDTSIDAATITFDVLPINRAPSATGSTITLLEDQPYVFSSVDLGYGDPDGNALKELIITALPARGTLTLAGNAVAPNQVVAVAALSSLAWTPPAEASGVGLASISFVVRDVGGTVGGGSDTSATSGALRFNVTNVNDSPTITTSAGSGSGGALTVNEGTLNVTSVTVFDPDSKKVTLSLVGEDKGLFVLSKNQLQFKPAPDFETPRDANKDGIYKVGIRAIDNGVGAVASVQELTITVRNVAGSTTIGDDGANTLDKSKKVAGVPAATAEEDFIDGRGGNDNINGGDGADTLIGGLGNDKLTGGNGADHFRFTEALGPTNVDAIADFVRGTDKIELSAGVFGALGATVDPWEIYSAKGAVAGLDGDDYMIYDSSKGRLFYDPDGAGADFAPILFATFTKKPPMLDAGDFVIV